MSYVAIYRKFRPQAFDQVKGQEAIVRTLQNQIANNRIGHAYLFTGTRGTGKTTVARIFAKAINCENPKDGNPCNECKNCKAITNGSFLDVVELDAASNNGVDEIRRVIDEVQYTPVSGKYKVYILDEAHMLSSSASNAFLKTLEEPPEHAIFILATTDPNKLPVTILSRCQRYDFKRITAKEIKENIKECLEKEGIEAEEKAVEYIARAGDGSMRDSLSLLDKAIAFNLGKKITYKNTLDALGTVDTESFSKLFRFIVNGDTFNAIEELDNEIKQGKELGQYINDFVWYIRNLLMVSIGSDKDFAFLGISESNLKILKEDANLVESEILIRYVRILSELINSLKFASAKQVLAEVAIIKLARAEMETDYASILDRLRRLEAGHVENRNVPVTNAADKAPVKILETSQPESVPYKTSENKGASFENNIEAPSDEKIDEINSLEEENQSVISEGNKPSSEYAPSDIVSDNWRKIVDSVSPLLRVYLAKADMEIVDDSTIKIVVSGLTDYGKIVNGKESIKELIKKTVNADVNIEVERKEEKENNIQKESDDEDEDEQRAEVEYIPSGMIYEAFEDENEIDDIQKIIDAEISIKVETEE